MRLLTIGLVLTTLLLAGCTGKSAPSLPDRAPLVEGQITKIENERVLVEATPEKEEGAKCWFALAKKTVLVRDGAAVTASDLQVGQQVKAWEDGAVAESYPCQATAQAIEIK